MNGSKPLKVGAVLFPGFELLDLYGPLEMFGLLNSPEAPISLTMLAEQHGSVTSSAGPKGMADAPLEEARNLDLLLIPGGIGTRVLVEDQCFLEALLQCSASSTLVATVCTGSALLAKTGFLDGCRATSNKLAFDWVRSQGPNVHWVRKARWVHDGRCFTSSGISSGMDMTLEIISNLYGRESALRVAQRAEYLWNENPQEDPFA